MSLTKKFWGRLLLLCWLVLPKKFEFNFRYNKLCLNKLHYSLWFLHHVKAIYHLFWHEKSIYFISDCIQILWARQISITVTTYLKIFCQTQKTYTLAGLWLVASLLTGCPRSQSLFGFTNYGWEMHSFWVIPFSFGYFWSSLLFRKTLSSLVKSSSSLKYVIPVTHLLLTDVDFQIALKSG